MTIRTEEIRRDWAGKVALEKASFDFGTIDAQSR